MKLKLEKIITQLQFRVVYLRGFFFEDKRICCKKRKASDVLVQTIPFHTPAMPKFPLGQTEYPPAKGKPTRMIYSMLSLRVFVTNG